MGIRFLGLLIIAFSLLFIEAELEFFAFTATALVCLIIHSSSLSGIDRFSFKSMPSTQAQPAESHDDAEDIRFRDQFIGAPITAYDLEIDRINNPAYAYLSDNIHHDHSNGH